MHNKGYFTQDPTIQQKQPSCNKGDEIFGGPILKEQKQLQKLIISVIWNVKSPPRINFLDDILSRCLYFVSSKLIFIKIRTRTGRGGRFHT